MMILAISLTWITYYTLPINATFKINLKNDILVCNIIKENLINFYH